MKFSFTAIIYKVGINPCVAVPFRITSKMTARKGYIPIKGKIKNHLFSQTLVPISNAEYRLYVNGLMLKGANAKIGDSIKFIIEQDETPRTVDRLGIPKEFQKQLEENELIQAFRNQTEYRQKEILKYLNHLKTKDALLRNIAKVIQQLKNK